MKKIISLLLILVLSLGLLVSCGDNGSHTQSTPPTNDEMIKSRISAFTTAYGNGSWEQTMASLSTRTRATLDAMMDILGGIGGGILGIDIDLRDLFTISINVTGTQFAELNITKIDYTTDSDAVVTTESDVYGNTVLFYFVMVKEGGSWYIDNMTDKKPSTGSESGNNKVRNMNYSFHSKIRK